MVERLFLAVPRGCLQFVIVVFPDHTHLLFLKVSSEHVFHMFLFNPMNISNLHNMWCKSKKGGKGIDTIKYYT